VRQSVVVDHIDGGECGSSDVIKVLGPRWNIYGDSGGGVQGRWIAARNVGWLVGGQLRDSRGMQDSLYGRQLATRCKE